jgi:hypothetical protein
MPWASRRRLLAHTDRWYSNHIPALKPIIGLDSAFVYPHLSSSQDAIDAGLWHTLEMGYEKVIDTLTFLALAYL